MARNRRSNRKAETDTRKPPARFVRRRRSSRRGHEAGEEPQLDANGPVETNPAGAKGTARGSQRAWSKAPRPAEPPPKNPAVFSYTHTIRKTS